MNQLHKLFSCDTMSHFSIVAKNLKLAEPGPIVTGWQSKRTRQLVARLLRANGLPLEDAK